MASELCMNCFSVKGQYEVCPFCGYVEGTKPKQPHYLTPGTILANHFIVGNAIGFGGFGITYKCFDTTLGVVVAVKEFYPAGLVNRAPGECSVGLLSGDKQNQYQAQLKRFLMEAQSIAQFGKAKDIVNVYDFFEANNTAYIIMEYVDGVLLKDYLERQGRMEPEVALNVIHPIIEAVKKIHAKGIIHRDIRQERKSLKSDILHRSSTAIRVSRDFLRTFIRLALFYTRWLRVSNQWKPQKENLKIVLNLRQNWEWILNRTLTVLLWRQWQFVRNCVFRVYSSLRMP